MKWKIEFHNKNKTKLIKTYSYFNGKLLNELSNFLELDGFEVECNETYIAIRKYMILILFQQICLI